MSDPIKVGSVEEVKRVVRDAADALAKAAAYIASPDSFDKDVLWQDFRQQAHALRSLNIVWEQGWVSVEERLPEPQRRVLVAGVPLPLAFVDDEGCWRFSGSLTSDLNGKGYCYITGVTHWCYRPAPPTVKGEDVCSCGEKDAEVCRQNPSIAPSYCRVRAAKEEVKRG